MVQGLKVWSMRWNKNAWGKYTKVCQQQETQRADQKIWPDLYPHGSAFMLGRRFVPEKRIRRAGKRSHKSLLRTASSYFQKQKFSDWADGSWWESRWKMVKHVNTKYIKLQSNTTSIMFTLWIPLCPQGISGTVCRGPACSQFFTMSSCSLFLSVNHNSSYYV